MRHRFCRRHLAPFLPLPLLVVRGAGAVAQAAPAPSAGQDAAGQDAATVGQAADRLVFRVVPEQSTATFRVREQLAGFTLPNDAVGATRAVTGQLAVSPEGALLGDASKITVDLRQLQTDSAQRDTFIRQTTLQTGRYPLAEFVPTRAEGLPPGVWPASGQDVFTVIGLLTVHGVQQEVTWQTTATREADRLTGHATTVITFGDFGMTAPRVPVVLSVTDEIHLELDLVATLAT